MRTAVLLLLGVLSMTLAAPVKEPQRSEPVENTPPIGPPLEHTSPRTVRTIYYPVPRPETVLGSNNPMYYQYPNPIQGYNPYMGYMGYGGYGGYSEYGLGYGGYGMSNPYRSVYSVPPIVISLPKFN